MRGGKIEKKHLQGHFSRSSSHDPNCCRRPLLTPPAAFTLTTTFARCTATSAILQILPKPYGTFTCIFTVRNEVAKVMFLHLCVCPQGGCLVPVGGQWRIWGGRAWRVPPHGPKFSQFHAVFCKIWQNHMLAPPPEGWRPLLWGILDLPLGGPGPRRVCSQGCLLLGGCLVPGRGSAPGGECLDLVVSGGIPACTEADPPPADSYFCGQYASYWNACLLDSIKTSLRIPTQYKDPPPHIKFIITTSTLRC